MTSCIEYTHVPRKAVKLLIFTIVLITGMAYLIMNTSTPMFPKNTKMFIDLKSKEEINQISIIRYKADSVLNENYESSVEHSKMKEHNVGFLQKPRNYSLKQAVVTRFAKKTDDKTMSDNYYSEKRGIKLRQLLALRQSDNERLDDFISSVEKRQTRYELNKTAFGKAYRLSTQRLPTYDFPYIISGSDICKDVEPFLIIMVPSVHTHIDTRETIRQTWGRAAKPGVWPKMGHMNDTVRLVFLLGRGDKEIKNKIIVDEHVTYGDIMQADFIESYFNLTLKIVSGIRWVAQFCPSAKYILKADEDVFVHIPNLINMLKKEKYLDKGGVYGHVNNRPAVFREGKWGVTIKTYPLDRYPSYASGNTYVISGNIAAKMFYVAGHLPYMNIEDAFVCGIVRSFIGGQIFDVRGFTHWYEKKPRPCEFKNTIRISATKTDDSLKQYIWDILKTNAKDCYYVVHRNTSETLKRPEIHMQNRPSFRHSIRDEHIFFNKTSGQFYAI